MQTNHLTKLNNTEAAKNRSVAHSMKWGRMLLRSAGALGCLMLFCQCAGRDTANTMVVSVPQQKMSLYHEGKWVRDYPVSTSKFGEGDQPGSNCTPLGEMEVAAKIGEGQPLGTVFKSRRPTGEVVPVNSPGRDPIVTRILWLKGLEDQNDNAYHRYIYVHGTPEERTIGTRASYGCIRMRSCDVADLYDRVGVGARIKVVDHRVYNLPQMPDMPELAFFKRKPREESQPDGGGLQEALVPEPDVQVAVAESSPREAIRVETAVSVKPGSKPESEFASSSERPRLVMEDRN